MTICFDMDGTIADLYGVENWLEKIRAEDASPYMDAPPLLNMRTLARKLNQLKDRGFRLCIVSWGAMESSEDFLEETAKIKKEWLDKHLHSVKWDSINIVPYGTPKSKICPFHNSKAILFDDSPGNREEWGKFAFNETNIMDILGLL